MSIWVNVFLITAKIIGGNKYVRGDSYTNTTETVRFYDGIILYSKNGIHADATIGEYDRSWSGTIISNYKEEHINDMVTFNNKGVKIGKLYIELP